jgi:predicted metalloprotease with PDZ domain
MLAAAMIAALMPGVVVAQTPDEAALRKELNEARSALAAARERVSEISTRLGEDRVVQIHRINDKRPMLGFVLGANEAKGVRLDAVTPDSPAARAGLRSGDVLTAIDGQAIQGEYAAERIGDAQRRLGGLKDQQPVVIAYEREGKPAQVTATAELMSPFAFLHDLDVPSAKQWTESIERIDFDQLEADIGRSMSELGKLSELGDIERRIRVIGPLIDETIRFDAWRWQGLRLASLDADLGRYFGAQQGVLVLKAEGDSLAGLKSGDVIQSVDGESVGEPREAMRMLAEADPGETIALDVLRDRRRIDLTLTAPEKPDVFKMIAPPPPPVPPAPPAPPAGAPSAPPPPPPPDAVPAPSAPFGRVI